MLSKLPLVLFALMLLPVADAAAQNKEKPSQATDNCREQAEKICPRHGIHRNACLRSALTQCKRR
jgi:hypothetical protein